MSKVTNFTLHRLHYKMLTKWFIQMKYYIFCFLLQIRKCLNNFCFTYLKFSYWYQWLWFFKNFLWLFFTHYLDNPFFIFICLLCEFIFFFSWSNINCFTVLSIFICWTKFLTLQFLEISSTWFFLESMVVVKWLSCRDSK